MHKIFFISLLGFLVGIFFSSLFDFDIIFALFAIVLSFFVWLYTYLIKFHSDVNKKKILFVSLFIFSLSLGVLRFEISEINQGSDVLNNLINQNVALLGVVIDEPDERENNTKIVVKVNQFMNNQKQTPIESKVLVTVDHYPNWNYGDELLLTGIIKKPQNFSNDNGGRIFDYISYLSKDEIFYLMFYPQTEFVSSGKGNFIKEKLFTFKKAFLSNISEVIAEPEASLLGGLVVGAKQSLGEDLLDDFRKTGIIHIVVLSGYNVTIVAEAIMRFFSFLPRAFNISFGAISIILFAIMTGAGATIVRASIMALLVILARATGRVYEITLALFVAGFLMVFQNPKILVFDPSFQLSFMATLGLIYLAPVLEKYFQFVPTRFQIREFAMATLATQIFVLPLLLYKIGELSLVSLPVNLLILILIPLTMLAGFLAGIFGFVSTILSLPFAFIAYALLFYELKIVEIFASIPFASVSFHTFPLWLMISIYFIYGIFIYKLTKQKYGEKNI